MATHSSIPHQSLYPKIALSLCEGRLEQYKDHLFRSFCEKNWEGLAETSLCYENDCYSLGEIEIAGKLIGLRLQLQMVPRDIKSIESYLNKIFELSVRLQFFLINYLKSQNLIEEDQIQYINMPQTSLLEESANYSTCSIQ